MIWDQGKHLLSVDTLVVITKISTNSACCAVASKAFGKLPENTTPETIKLRMKAGFTGDISASTGIGTHKIYVLTSDTSASIRYTSFVRERTCAERHMKSSVAEHYGCKRARHCDLIANGRTQADRDFSCEKKTAASLAPLAAQQYSNCNCGLFPHFYSP